MIEGIGQKILRIVLMASAVVGFDKIIDYFIASGQIGISVGILAVGLVGLGIYFKTKMNATIFQISTFFMVVTMFGLYIYNSMLVPALKQTTMFTDLGMSTSNVSKFLMIFSLSYGASQLIGGFIISKFKLYGYACMIILGGLCILGQSFSSAFDSCYNFRLLSGVFLSVSGVIVSFYPAKYWPKEYLNLMINTVLFLGIKLAAIAANIAGTVATSDSSVWRALLKSNGFGLIGMTILFLIVVNVFGKTAENKEESSGEEAQDDGKSILADFIDMLTKDKRIIIACILCAVTVANFYFLRFSGYWGDFIKDVFPNENFLAADNLMNNVNSYGMILGPMLLTVISIETIMLGFAIVQLVAFSLFLLFAKTSMGIVLFCSVGAALGMAVHSYPPVLFGAIYGKRKSAGLLFGILNIFPMLLGSFFGQLIGMTLATNNWVTTGSKMSADGKAILSSDNILYSLKMMFPCTIASVIFVFYIWKIRKKES